MTVSKQLFTGKEFAVFGATGNLGEPIAKQLLLQGAQVHAIARSKSSLRVFAHSVNYPDNLSYHSAEIPLCLHGKSALGSSLPKLNGFVYCIGHCPPYGFDDEVKNPLSCLPIEILRRDLQNHVTYLVQTYQYLLHEELLRQQAQVVVIGSAITRLTEETCPPWLHAWHYIAANAAKEALVQCIRHDPITKEMNWHVHYLAFGAVDTPFHHECKHQPPSMIPVSKVVDEVLTAMQSETDVHKHIT